MKKKLPNGIVEENEMARHVRQAVDDYFKDLDGEDPSCAIHEMVMNCVEKPLIETVMHHAGGNQTRAAELLGLNRNTLRKKLLQYEEQATPSRIHPINRPERRATNRLQPTQLNGKKVNLR